MSEEQQKEAGFVELLHEANRHIEALAAMRKDNSWDMIDARSARNEIIDAMKQRFVESRGGV